MQYMYCSSQVCSSSVFTGVLEQLRATGDLTEWLSTIVDEDPFPQDFVECKEYGSGNWPDGPHERCRSAC